jgi:hypothetical protein
MFSGTAQVSHLVCHFLVSSVCLLVRVTLYCTQNIMYTSDSALIIFQSSLARPGGVTATNVSWGLPSVFTNEACFSVYAAPGSTASAIAAPVSPWCPSAWEQF